jgi:hypothetical protein
MGVMSRRVLPACSSLCYFCPSLRARSRQPVKRYKKIISEIYQLPAVWPILPATIQILYPCVMLVLVLVLRNEFVVCKCVGGLLIELGMMP